MDLRHIAVIMDGNRRWAENRGLHPSMGHKRGADTLRAITKASINLGIKYLTVYAFSTENWNRKKDEVAFLMKLFSETIKAEIPVFIKNDIKLTFLGSKTGLSEDILKVMDCGENETARCSSLNLQIAFNYGARLEITEAVKNICSEVKSGALNIQDITEDTITNHLYTKNIPCPDLLIRTGGEYRISNYLLWQCAYSEIYITDTFWPDFDETALKKAIDEFNTRKRRFGR